MDDPRAAEGVEHLQTAAHELLAAARSFLDVAEELIADPERFSGAAAGLVDLFRGASTPSDQPWERAASIDFDEETENAEPADRPSGDRGRVKRIAVD